MKPFSSPLGSLSAVLAIALITGFLLLYDPLLDSDNFRYMVMTEFINLYSLVFPLVLSLVTLGASLAAGGLAGLLRRTATVAAVSTAAFGALAGYLQILAGVMLAGTALRIVESGTGRAQAYLVVTGLVLGLLVLVTALPWATGRLFTRAGQSRLASGALALVGAGLLATGPYFAVWLFG